MKFLVLFVFSFLFIDSCNNDFAGNALGTNTELLSKIKVELDYAVELNNIDSTKSKRIFPRTISEPGKLKKVTPRDWTSGFYPGVLWNAYILLGNDTYKREAIRFTEKLESEQLNAASHDLGFKMMSSYGLGYAATGKKQYAQILIQSARTLISRFDARVGCIRSWDHHKDKWQFPVIIDNMMNLELLFFAWKETGDPVFYNVALAHARTTMKNHFRKDYSSYHVIDYDTLTGHVLKRNTHQGYADESSWARGQAWALYGYTMVYRKTKLPEFLQQAEKIANYILNIAVLPKDNIPYWDFNAPNIPNEPRDASAAAVMASAFYELSTFSEDQKDVYISMADKIMHSLSTPSYFTSEKANSGFLLTHSTGSKPQNSEVDATLIYADYYYLEALNRKNRIEKIQ